MCADEVVVWQLGEFREVRALAGLQRIANFDPSAEEMGLFGRTRQELAKVAREAIAKIEGGPPKKAKEGRLDRVSAITPLGRFVSIARIENASFHERASAVFRQVTVSARYRGFERNSESATIQSTFLPAKH